MVRSILWLFAKWLAYTLPRVPGALWCYFVHSHRWANSVDPEWQYECPRCRRYWHQMGMY